MSVQENWQGAVEQIRRATTVKGREQLGCFSIEGIRLHERALSAPAEFIVTVVADTFGQDDTPRIVSLRTQLQDAKQPYFIVPPAEMAKLTNGRSLGGIISLLKKPTVPTLAELCTPLSNPILLIAQGIVDPGNIGAMIRTAHANNVSAFISSGGSDPYHPKTVRTSMGSIFKLPILQRPSLDDLRSELAELHIETVGTVSTKGIALPHAQFSRSGTAVFMGNEYFGLPDDLLPKLNKLITIPMRAGIDSMSVNAATAVVLYELQRQNFIR